MAPETLRIPSHESGPDRAGIVAAGFLLLLAAVIGYDLSTLDLTSVYGLGPQAMPGLIAIGLTVLAIANAIIAFREGPQRRESVDLRAIVLILGGMGFLIACLQLGLGFIPGMTILFAATATAFGRTAYLVDLAIGLVLAVVIYLVFSKLLTLSLPIGPLERLF